MQRPGVPGVTACPADLITHHPVEVPMDRIKLSLDSVRVESFSTNSPQADFGDAAVISECTSCPTYVDRRCTCFGRDGAC